jgi:hypothetical protein
MGEKSDFRRAYSRRDFIRGAPLAAAGGSVLNALADSGLLARIGVRRRPPVFPEGSIFTPAKDPREKA